MESFCVRKEGNTAQDIQDLFDLAVWAGFKAEDSISKTKKMFKYDDGCPFSIFKRFGILRGFTWVFSHGYPTETIYKEISYKDAINHILGSNHE